MASKHAHTWTWITLDMSWSVNGGDCGCRYPSTKQQPFTLTLRGNSIVLTTWLPSHRDQHSAWPWLIPVILHKREPRSPTTELPTNKHHQGSLYIKLNKDFENYCCYSDKNSVKAYGENRLRQHHKSMWMLHKPCNSEGQKVGKSYSFRGNGEMLIEDIQFWGVFWCCESDAVGDVERMKPSNS